MTVLTINPESWYIAGISPCVVFAILIVLVLVLVCFGVVARRSGAHKPATVAALAPGKHADAADGDDLAVVATAVYLYLIIAHDEESGVLNFKKSQPSNWHAVVNPRL